MSLVDINVERGQATEREFQQKYGSERAVFMQCDVSSSKQLKGRPIIAYYKATKVTCRCWSPI